MFVEGDVELLIKDRAILEEDDYALKLWIQRAFKDMCCYRISNLEQQSSNKYKVTVALKTDILPESERHMVESHGKDVGMLRTFIEKMFMGKGTCKAVGDPKLRDN